MLRRLSWSFSILAAAGLLAAPAARGAEAKSPSTAEGGSRTGSAAGAKDPPAPDRGTKTAPDSPPAAPAAPASPAPPDTPKPTTNRPAPDFELPDLRGIVVSSDYLSRPVTVVHFWATWCVPCVREIPELNRLAERYEPSGAALYAVAIGSGTAGDLRQIEKSYRIHHRVLIGDDRLAHDFGGVSAFPVTFLIDNRGWIVEKHEGATREAHQRIEETIRGMLAAAGRPLPER